MTMKDITELTPTEIGELIRNNCAFQDRCIDSIMEHADMVVNDEYLADYKWDYSICNSRGDYLHMPNLVYEEIEEFVNWYRDVQDAYELFDEDEMEMLCEYIDAAKYHICHEDEFLDEIDIRLWRAENDAREIIFRKMLDVFDYDDSSLLDEADYVIWDEMRDGDYYVTEEWEIIRDVPEVVIPRHMETVY